MRGTENKDSGGILASERGREGIQGVTDTELVPVIMTKRELPKSKPEGEGECVATETHPNESIQLHPPEFQTCLCLCVFYRVDGECPLSPCASLQGEGGGGGGGSEQRLQVKIQAFEEKMGGDGGEVEVEENSPAPQRRYSLSQAVREERREMRFNRFVSTQHHMALPSHDGFEWIVRPLRDIHVLCVVNSALFTQNECEYPQAKVFYQDSRFFPWIEFDLKHRTEDN